MDNLQPGQMLGAYRILGQIGQGGMATVYKAYHAAMDRYVAVKVLPFQLAENPEFSGRFQQEARTIARLEHARILPVYDYGESNGLAYLVMRFLDAGTLKDQMRTGPKSLAEVDRLFTQLAEALDYAHRQGVVHRDLKPSNVLIDAQGDLFLTDFGIAKLLEGGAQFTSTGAMMGTPAYMSPEQAQGEKVDQRSDIYSLGIILYELTTGRVPFEAETPLAVVLKQINAPLPPPSSLKPDFPPALERVLLKALAKSPADRFASVAEFLAAWKAALTQVDTVRAAAPTPAEVEAAVPSTLVGSTPATVVGSTSAGAPPAAPKPFPVLPVVGAVALLAVLGIVLAVFVLPNLSGGPSTEARATATLAATQAATSAAAPATPANTEVAAATEAAPATEAPGASAELEWRSWTAANRVRALFVDDGELVAAGPGGVTVWNESDGTVLNRYTTGDGLPHPNIFSAWADEDGTLWVATEHGLGRLNPGADEWITYDSADGLDSDIVTSIVRAGEFLVIASHYSGQDGGGLNLFDGQKWGPAPGFPSTNWEQALAQGKLANNVNVLLADGNRLWVGTELGLGRYENDSQTWTRYTTNEGLPSNRIFSLYVDHDGTLLVGTETGAARFDGSAFQKIDQGPPYGVYGIVEDADNRYYFSGGGGIWRYDAANANWEEFSTGTGDLLTYNMTGATAAEDGSLFFGSDGAGLARYDGDEFTPWYQNDSTVVAWHGRFLRTPDESELWAVELYGAYVDRFNREAFAWEPYTENPCDCAPLIFDADGNLWGGRWQAGFVILAPDGALTEVGVDQGLPTEVNASVIAPLDDGTAWIGTDEDGLAFYDGAAVQFMSEAEGGPPRERVWSLFLASDGALWAAVGERVSRRDADGNWEHFTRGDPFDAGNFGEATDFAEDADGALWLTSDGAGVYRYLDGAWEQYLDGRRGVDLPSAYLYAVAVAPDGSLWFGGEGGAARFDGTEWAVYRVEDGLIHSLVYDIYAEPSGAVWFATAGGVSRYGP